MKVKLKPIGEQRLVITGATSGIGLATARLAVNRGASVVLVARNEEALERAKTELEGAGGRAVVCVADVARQDDVDRIVATAIAALGGFDSWVNNAASATYGPIEQIPLEDQSRIFDVNYHGTLMGSLAALAHFRESGGGAIVNMGSVLSDRAMIYQGPYSATKAAVQAATDALRMEAARDGVPVSITLIKPASINSPYPEHARNYMTEPPRLPPPLYDPSLVADAILFACETPCCHLYVGGGGFLISLAGRLAPRLTDKAMQAVGVEIQQKPGDPGDAAKRDNLAQPRKDGAVHGDQDVFVRQTSVLLQAQKQPLLVPFVAAAAAVEIAQGVVDYFRSEETQDG